MNMSLALLAVSFSFFFIFYFLLGRDKSRKGGVTERGRDHDMPAALLYHLGSIPSVGGDPELEPGPLHTL